MAPEISGQIDFRPPIEDTEIVGFGEQGTSATVFLTDANHHLFSLHVSAEGPYRQDIKDEADEPQEPDADAEPTFVVPGQALSIDALQLIVHGTDPNLLKKYLVPQSTLPQDA